MTADHGSDRQRTVAELLQQYGGDSRNGGGRRRRRAAEPEEAPEPRAPAEPPAYRPPIQERPEPATRPGDLGGTSALDPTWASLDSPASRTPNPDTGGFDARNGSGSFSASPLDALGGGAAPGSTWDRPSYGASSAPSADPFTTSSPYSGTGIYQAQPYPSGIYQSDPVTSSGPVRPPEEATDQLPRFRDRAGSAESTQLTSRFAGRPNTPDAPGRATVEDSGPSTAVASRAALFDDDEEEDSAAEDPDGEDTEGKAGGGWAARRAARKKARAAERAHVGETAAMDERTKAVAAVGADTDGEHDTDAPAGLDDGDDVEVEPSGFKVWAVLIAQGVLGAVGGAGLWVGFSYLWRNLPVVALVAAVVATGGLVLMVRTIRGSDDLRTTMLAVLVGLVVTISPVALMIATSAR